MNKRLLKYLLLTILALSAAQVKAYTNKTFLMPRSHAVNLPMQYTTFNELINRKTCNSFGGNFQVTGFYQASTNESEQGKYFLVHDKSTIRFRAQESNVNGNAKSAITDDVDFGYFVHVGGLTGPGDTSNFDNANITLSLNPRQRAYGVSFDYYQNLSSILNGLYFSAHMPLVHIENDTRSTNGGDSVVNVGGENIAFGTFLADYFKGNFTQTLATDRTAKLTHAKIGPKQATSGFADLDLQLGYKIFDGDCFSLSIGLGGTIPTGNKATGVFMFEPIRGNGQHYAVGGDLSTSIRLFGNYCHNLKFNLTAQYRYLFEDRERRTMGIKGRGFGQYFLLGQNGSNTLVPAANVLTLPVNVTPGNQFDGIAGFTYNNGRFTLDCGYNIYYRDEERVRLRDTFVDNTYAIAARGFDTNAGDFDITNVDNIDNGGVNPAGSIINNSTIDTSVAQTPSQLTHSVYGGIGGVFNKSGDVAFMVSAGGKYEWVDQNSALEQWSVYGKLGFGF